MTRNVGPEDRVVRVVMAIALAVLIYVGAVTGFGAILLGIIAAIMLISGVVGFSLLYKLTDIDTSIQEQAYTKPDDRIDF